MKMTLGFGGKKSKHKVVLRHYFISMSKDVNFLNEKPTHFLFFFLCHIHLMVLQVDLSMVQVYRLCLQSLK